MELLVALAMFMIFVEVIWGLELKLPLSRNVKSRLRVVEAEVSKYKKTKELNAKVYCWMSRDDSYHW